MRALSASRRFPRFVRAAVFSLSAEKLLGILRLIPRMAFAFALTKPFRILCLLYCAILAVGPLDLFAVRPPVDRRSHATTRLAVAAAIRTDRQVAALIGVPLRTMSFTPLQNAGNVSPLADHVVGILSVLAQKEVFRVHAGRVVAMMANEHPVWDGPDIQLMRDAVCECRSPRLMPHDDAVALPVSRRSPNPALAQVRSVRRNGAVHLDLLPKAFSDRAISHASNLAPLHAGVNHVFIGAHT